MKPKSKLIHVLCRRGNLFSGLLGAARVLTCGVVVCGVSPLSKSFAAQVELGNATNAFPSVAEVIGGRTFDTFTDMDIYFMRAIHDRYSEHWPSLLEVNITLNDYLLAPAKMLRFVTEVGEAMRGQNDPDACKYLSQITGDPSFYANGQVSRPEIVRAAARALIQIGSSGSKALAAAITQEHYQTDSASLEEIADVIGDEQPANPEFVKLLAAVAFDYRATNGAYYQRCTTTAAKNLLLLKGGPAAVRSRLNIEALYDSPGRFQAIMDGIAAGCASDLATNLASLQALVHERVAALAASPGGYRDDLQELEARIGKTVAILQKITETHGQSAAAITGRQPEKK